MEVACDALPLLIDRDALARRGALREHQREAGLRRERRQHVHCDPGENAGASPPVDGQRAEPALPGAERRDRERAVHPQRSGYVRSRQRVVDQVVDDYGHAAARDSRGSRTRGQDRADRVGQRAGRGGRAVGGLDGEAAVVGSDSDDAEVGLGEFGGAADDQREDGLRVLSGQRQPGYLGGRREHAPGEGGIHDIHEAIAPADVKSGPDDAGHSALDGVPATSAASLAGNHAP